MKQDTASAGRFPNLAIDEQLCFALCRAARAITRAYAQRLAPLGLTYPQYLVMLALWEEQPMAAGKIAERICLDPSSLTPLLKRLESNGLVTRHRPADNQRKLLVGLTQAGRDLQARTADVQHSVAAVTGLDVGELAAMRDDLHALADQLLDADRQDSAAA
ncbi:MAG: MarR family transcriptional regulator [Salinisphaeraceae bacterium]